MGKRDMNKQCGKQSMPCVCKNGGDRQSASY